MVAIMAVCERCKRVPCDCAIHDYESCEDCGDPVESAARFCSACQNTRHSDSCAAPLAKQYFSQMPGKYPVITIVPSYGVADMPYPYFVRPQYTISRRATSICRAPLVCFGQNKYILCCAIHADPEDWDAVLTYLLKQKEIHYANSEGNVGES